MACAFGLPELASRNVFIKEYEETGYLIDFIGGYLVFSACPISIRTGSFSTVTGPVPLTLTAK